MNIQEFLNTGFDNGCIEYHLRVHRTPHGITKIALTSTGAYDIECDGVVVDSKITLFENVRVE